jgi:hypothetical protein
MFSMFLGESARPGAYPRSTYSALWFVAERRREKRWALTPEVVRRDDELGEVLQALVRPDPEWRGHSERIGELQRRLRRQVPGEAWRTYLELEEHDAARWQRALLLVARRAFESGRLRRRQ